MKAADLHLRDLLDFNHDLIRFAGHRSLIVDADALGILRKELVESLGLTTARGFLTRMGFAMGWVTADRFKRELPWADAAEWRRAGGRLHTLKGHVRVEIPEWKGPGPEPFAWAIWHESYEAEQHIRHLGQADEATCWTLTGFASGYLSYANNQPYLVMEQRCVGKGDAVCSIQARSRDEWGEEGAEMAALLDSPILASGLDQAVEQLKKVERRLHNHRGQVAEDLIARSEPMQRVLDLAHRVARVDSVVLVTGESGVGKERVAGLIHRESARMGGPFLAVNCGAVSETLLESELFGHARGAFTGAARDRAGLFEAANGGTLFLDEVGELPPAMQVKLLRVLQEREVRRVGENQGRAVDVRIITATNRDLDEEVAAGRFRLDLLYRLKVFRIHIPSLSCRKEDILPLAHFFLERLGRRMKRVDVNGFEPSAIDLLTHYGWPGNVRELENAVEHALVMASGSRIQIANLPEEIRGGATIPGTMTPISPDRRLDEVERDHILAVFKSVQGNRAEAAKTLGIGTATLYRKLQRYREQGWLV